MASDSSEQMSSPIRGTKIMKGTLSIRIQDWLLHINFFNYIFLVTLIVMFFNFQKFGGGELEATPAPPPATGLIWAQGGGTELSPCIRWNLN